MRSYCRLQTTKIVIPGQSIKSKPIRQRIIMLFLLYFYRYASLRCVNLRFVVLRSVNLRSGKVGSILTVNRTVGIS
jgi:hypothetical protein